MNVVVRTAGDPNALLPVLPRVISAIDADIPVTGAQRPGALTDVVSGQLARQRLTVTVLSGFASGALLLAALGIFGVIAYVVTLRTREFGVRAALGATPRQIVRLVIRQTAWIVTTGLVLGLARVDSSPGGTLVQRPTDGRSDLRQPHSVRRNCRATGVLLPGAPRNTHRSDDRVEK
jgi:putative ABC transport system permease protein